MEAKLKHLEIIQSTIARMAANTFMLKGWCVTLIAALCAIAIQDDRSRVYLLAYIPIFCFSALDAYYLWLERRFRDLYDSVRHVDSTAIDFGMQTTQFAKKRGGYFGAFFSLTVLLFYGTLVCAVLIVGLSLTKA